MIKNYGEMNLFIYSWRHGTFIGILSFFKVYFAERQHTHQSKQEQGKGQRERKKPTPC